MKCLIAILFCLSTTITPDYVRRVIDADTFVLYTIDGLSNEERIRVLGVNAWERQDPRSGAATAYTVDWLSRGPFTISGCKRDSFGRLLAWVTRGDDSLHADLISHGHGVRYP